MKKIFGIVCAAIMALLVAGCASTGSAKETAAYKQNKELNLPPWADVQFTTGMNKGNYYWGGSVDEQGFFASGSAKYSDVKSSTNAADLDGKANIAFHIKQEINATAQQEADAEGSEGERAQELKEFQSSVASIKVSGIMRVDRFIADDGTVYVLMFVPESEIKKAVPSNSEFAKRVMERYIASLGEEKR